MRLDVQKVLLQVKDEVIRRGGAFAEDTMNGSITTGAFPHWVATVPPVKVQPSYALADLLAPDDRAFIESAYLAILRRRPDAEGMRVNLEQLRLGRMSKIEILGMLRWSQEGLARGVHVDGLLIPYTVHKWKRKPYIGALLRWAMAVAQISQHAERTRRLEAAHAAETHELGRVLNTLSRQVQMRLLRLEESGFDRDRENSDRVEEVAAELADLRVAFDKLQVHIQAELGDLRDQLQELRHPKVLNLDAMYVAFEEKFRGPAELIRARATPYIDIMREAGAGSEAAPVVDLGSGRGDWLEILREHGLAARGVDSNGVFVGLCQLRGLDVVQGDVMDVLRAMPDGSAGGITGMHIAEHLPLDVLVEMIDECMRVLQPGGVLALETPNPENPWVSSLWFWLDPTHRNPLPPQTLEWMVEARGFEAVRIERWTVARDVGAPAFVPAEVPGAESMNVLIGQTHAAPDYAIVARKPR